MKQSFGATPSGRNRNPTDSFDLWQALFGKFQQYLLY